MQAVILCAGKGTRMGDLTQEIPKPLLTIHGKSLLEYKLRSLPDVINEIILIIGYKGEKIRETLGNSFRGIPITYIEDKTLTGTAHALWNAKEILQGRFLVMMGDDIYDKTTLKACTQYDFSIACKVAERNESGSRVTFNNTGTVENFVTHDTYKASHEDGGLVFTGLYSLTTDIFKYSPVKLKTKEEWGLPQTLLSTAKDHTIVVVQTNFWKSITEPKDLIQEQDFLKN